jgi:hypothetical protein
VRSAFAGIFQARVEIETTSEQRAVGNSAVTA